MDKTELTSIAKIPINLFDGISNIFFSDFILNNKMPRITKAKHNPKFKIIL